MKPQRTWGFVHPICRPLPKIAYFPGGNTNAGFQAYADRMEDSTNTRADASCSLPGVLGYAGGGAIGDRGYTFGGYNGSITLQNVYVIQASVATCVTSATAAAISSYAHSKELANIGDCLYAIGSGNSSNINQRLSRAPETVAAMSSTPPQAAGEAPCMPMGVGIYYAGGYTHTNVIHKTNICTDSCANLSAALSVGREALCGDAFPQKCYMAGGWTGSQNKNTIDVLGRSTETCAALAETLVSVNSWLRSAIIGVNHYIWAGNTGAKTNVVQCLKFNTETNAALSTTARAAIDVHASCAM